MFKTCTPEKASCCSGGRSLFRAFAIQISGFFSGMSLCLSTGIDLKISASLHTREQIGMNMLVVNNLATISELVQKQCRNTKFFWSKMSKILQF